MNGGTKTGISTISVERLQCARQDSAGPTERRSRKRKPAYFGFYRRKKVFFAG
jgi:hypothetical protein